MTGKHTWRWLEVKPLLVELGLVRVLTTPGDVCGRVCDGVGQALMVGELLDEDGREGAAGGGVRWG